jgi:hypothetical protein
VGNPRRDVVVSDRLRFSPASISIYNAKVRRKDKPGLNNMKKTETSAEQNSLQVSVCSTVCEESKRRWRSFRFIGLSSNFDNV